VNDLKQVFLNVCSNQCHAGFFFDARVLGEKRGIEESLAGRLECDTMLRPILNRLPPFPDECLAAIEEENVHSSCIYFAYAKCKQECHICLISRFA